MADAAVESAPADENDDSWLYGESTGEQIGEKGSDNADKPESQTGPAEDTTKEQKEQEENEGNNDDSHFDEHFADLEREEEDQTNGDADSQDNGDSDSDDSDDVKVTIGEIKSGPQTYASLNIKRGVGLVAPGAADKPRTGTTSGGKVTLEDLEGPGAINGVPALEYSFDSLEDKPWNKPGADISDYFNYGFNEVTWSAYCERQRRLRVSEAGVALHAGPPPRPPERPRPPGPIRNDEGMMPPMTNNYQVRENTIQVMTAERREYGRPHGRDAPEYFPPEHYPVPHYPPPPHTYEEHWGAPPPEPSGWTPSDIKELTPAAPPAFPPPPLYRHHAPPHHERPHRDRMDRDRMDRDRVDRERMDRERIDRDRLDRDRAERERRDDEERERERERDRERDRSRSIKPDRMREKSYRRERSRSRSRRHKSRSRSPRRERSRDRNRSRSRERDRDRDRERSIKPKNKDKDDDK